MTNNLPHIIEIAVLLLVAFLIGCLIGYFFRCVLFRPKVVKAAQTPSPKPAPVAAPAAAVAKAPKPAPVAAPTDGRPATLDKARDGKKDNLKRIKGIGPKIEGILNKLGIFHFDQIASWNRKSITWVDDYLSFKGRIDREEWISQAKKLAKGESTAFSNRVDRGTVPSSKRNTAAKNAGLKAKPKPAKKPAAKKPTVKKK